MRLKGIALLLLIFVALAASTALEEGIELAPGTGPRRLSAPGSSAPGAAAISPAGPASVRDPILGGWTADNAVAVPGFRGGTDYVLAPAAYRVDGDTDLLLHFELTAEAGPADEAGRWSVEKSPSFRLDATRAAIGGASASFRGPSSALTLRPGRGALFEKGSRFRDFSIEFWLYPANAENGEVILSWQSMKTGPSGSLPQSLTCAIAGGRISWDFQGFFERPTMPGSAGAAGTPAGAAASSGHYSLRATDPLVPRVWSHHLLRFDGDSGLLEYLADGVTEAALYLTSTGHETGARGASGGLRGGAEVFSPSIGAASALRLGADYAGLVDEFRITRSFVDAPVLAPYGRDGGLVLTPVADLGYGNSRLLSVDLLAKTPGATGIELSYRISDEWIGWRFDSPPWIPFRPGERLPDTARGRYVQVRADLYPDGTGRLTPSLSALTLHFEPDPLPPPPAKLVATAKDGAIELRWTRVPEADVAGYLVYYGPRPGDYYGSGAAEGPSPIDAGNVSSFTLTGLPNGGLVYLVVAVYDAASAPGMSARRAGDFSVEVSARPSRTAR